MFQLQWSRDAKTDTLFVCCASLQKKSGVVKPQEKKERWKEKKGAKRQKREDEESAVAPVVAAVTAAAAAGEQEEGEEEENVQPAVDPLENGFLHHAQREQERMNERLLKKTYSKKNKTVSPHLHLRPSSGRPSEPISFYSIWKPSSCLSL